MRRARRGCGRRRRRASSSRRRRAWPSASTPRASSSSASASSTGIGRLTALGPDLLGRTFDTDAALARLRDRGADAARRGAPRPAGGGRDRQRLQERDLLPRAASTPGAGRERDRRGAAPRAGDEPPPHARQPARWRAPDARGGRAVGLRPRRPTVPPLRDDHRGPAPGRPGAAHVLVPALPGSSPSALSAFSSRAARVSGRFASAIGSASSRRRVKASSSKRSRSRGSAAKAASSSGASSRMRGASSRATSSVIGSPISAPAASRVALWTPMHRRPPPIGIVLDRNGSPFSVPTTRICFTPPTYAMSSSGTSTSAPPPCDPSARTSRAAMIGAVNRIGSLRRRSGGSAPRAPRASTRSARSRGRRARRR